MSWTDELGVRFDEENWIWDYTDSKLEILTQKGNTQPCRVIFSFSSKISADSSEKEVQINMFMLKSIRQMIFAWGPQNKRLTEDQVYMDACNLKYTEGTKITDGKALNPKWHEFYMKALGEARVIIYCITDAYYASQWCRLEMENAFLRNDAWHVFLFLHRKDQEKLTEWQEKIENDIKNKGVQLKTIYMTMDGFSAEDVAEKGERAAMNRKAMTSIRRFAIQIAILALDEDAARAMAEENSGIWDPPLVIPQEY